MRFVWVYFTNRDEAWPFVALFMVTLCSSSWETTFSLTFNRTEEVEE